MCCGSSLSLMCGSCCSAPRAPPGCRYLLLEFPALMQTDPPPRVVELGCGVGSSLLPVLKANPAARVIATDISPAAVRRLWPLNCALWFHVCHAYARLHAAYICAQRQHWLSCWHSSERAGALSDHGIAQLAARDILVTPAASSLETDGRIVLSLFHMVPQVEMFQRAAAAAGICPSRHEALVHDAADNSVNPLEGAHVLAALLLSAELP